MHTQAHNKNVQDHDEKINLFPHTAVETIPTKPQDEGAESLQCLVAFVQVQDLSVDEAPGTRADDDGTDEAAEATNHVHHTAACEVDDAIGSRILVEQGACVAFGVRHGAPG